MSKESDTTHHLNAKWENLDREMAALGNKILNERASVAVDDGRSEICGIPGVESSVGLREIPWIGPAPIVCRKLSYTPRKGVQIHARTVYNCTGPLVIRLA